MSSRYSQKFKDGVSAYDFLKHLTIDELVMISILMKEIDNITSKNDLDVAKEIRDNLNNDNIKFKCIEEYIKQID